MTGMESKEIFTKANKKISFFLLGFLLLIPLVIVLYLTNILTYESNEVIALCVCVFILSVAPFFINRFSYNENFNCSCNLYCLELLLLAIAFNPLWDLTLVYLVMPVVSLIYFNRGVLHKMSIIAFLGMMFVKGVRLGTIVFCGIASGSELHPYYTDLLIASIEYIIAAIILLKVFEMMEDAYSKVSYASVMHKKEASEQPLSGNDLQSAASGRQKPDYGDVYDVQHFFAILAADMETLIKGKNKQFTLDLDNHMPVALYGKKALLRDALVNICSDLLMYKTESDVNMYVTYETGINLKKKENITMIIRIDSNAELNRNTADKKALGYFLSKKIIDELEGDLIELDDDGKTIFKIRLLQRVEDDQTIEERQNKQREALLELKEAAIADKAEETAGNMFHSDVHVMVVDDNREARKLVDSILTAVGISVTSAKSGVECLELLKTQEYDLVFIDDMMPDKSGVETVKEIRFQDSEYYQKLPVVMMSIHGGREDDKKYLAQGFTDCIRKPVNGEEVKACLKKWVKDDYRMSYEEYMRIQNEG
ncbi:MAG: response regulator [Lachnospiraceae bacterium]|nr:response regulator [Lachnospiraceae bacterium]